MLAGTTPPRGSGVKRPGTASPARQQARHQERLHRTLQSAARRGDLGAIRALPADVELNRQDEESGWTALHASIYRGYIGVARELVARGARVDLLDHELHSPIDLARSMVTPLQGDRDGCSEVMAWGVNANLAVGHKAGDSRLFPERVDYFARVDPQNVVDVVLCKFHAVFLCDNGALYTCGIGNGGRLGHGDTAAKLLPTRVSALSDHRAVFVSAAKNHTLIVTDCDSVFGFGINADCQLGFRSRPKGTHIANAEEVWEPPTLIEGLRGCDIIGAAAGARHSLFYSSSAVYACGVNAGHLGLPEVIQIASSPRKLVRIGENATVKQVVTGDDASAVLLASYAAGHLLVLCANSANALRSGGALSLIILSKYTSKRLAVSCKGLFSSPAFDKRFFTHLADPSIERVFSGPNSCFAALLASGSVVAWSRDSAPSLVWPVRESGLAAVDVSIGIDEFAIGTASGAAYYAQVAITSPAVAWAGSRGLSAAYRRIPHLHRTKRIACFKGTFLALCRSSRPAQEGAPSAALQTAPLSKLISDLYAETRGLSGAAGADVVLCCRGGEGRSAAHMWVLAERCAALKQALTVGHRGFKCTRAGGCVEVEVLSAAVTPLLMTAFVQWCYTGSFALPFHSWKEAAAAHAAVAEAFSLEKDDFMRQPVWDSLREMCLDQASHAASSADCEIVGPSGRRFRAHRALLAARVPYFASLFADEVGWQERGAQTSANDDRVRAVVDLSWAPLAALRAVLLFVYGETPLAACHDAIPHDRTAAHSHIADILILADYLRVREMFAAAEAHLEENLSLINLFQSRALADEVEADGLRDYCVRFAACNIDAALETRLLDDMPPAMLDDLTAFMKKSVVPQATLRAANDDEAWSDAELGSGADDVEYYVIDDRLAAGADVARRSPAKSPLSLAKAAPGPATAFSKKTSQTVPLMTSAQPAAVAAQRRPMTAQSPPRPMATPSPSVTPPRAMPMSPPADQWPLPSAPQSAPQRPPSLARAPAPPVASPPARSLLDIMNEQRAASSSRPRPVPVPQTKAPPRAQNSPPMWNAQVIVRGGKGARPEPHASPSPPRTWAAIPRPQAVPLTAQPIVPASPPRPSLRDIQSEQRRKVIRKPLARIQTEERATREIMDFYRDTTEDGTGEFYTLCCITEAPPDERRV